jgi:hypothetical protein
MTKKYVETGPYRPSNGSEGDGFEARFCDLCVRDAELRKEDPDFSKACPIHTAAIALDPEDAEYPKEWVEDLDDAGRGASARCSAYVPDGKAFAAAARRFVAREARDRG